MRNIGRSDTEITELGTLEGILGCVEAGPGFAVGPESAIRGYRNADQFILEPLPKPFAMVETHRVWRIDHRPVEAHKKLLDILGAPEVG